MGPASVDSTNSGLKVFENSYICAERKQMFSPANTPLYAMTSVHCSHIKLGIQETV